MSRTYHHGERRLRVRGIKQDPTDLRRLARALIDLGQAQAEAEAEAEHRKQTRRKTNQKQKGNSKQSGRGSADTSRKEAA
jgi:phage terminase large subunit